MKPAIQAEPPTSSPFDPELVESFRNDEDNLIVGYKNVVVQLRSGKLTLGVLQHIETVGRLFLGRQAGPVAAFLILEPTAEVTDGNLRATQSKTFKELFERYPRASAVTTILGDGPSAMLLRAVARILVRSEPRFKIVARFEEAAAWLGPRVGRGEQELLALAQWATHEKVRPPRTP
jgi:hypothetical protein